MDSKSVLRGVGIGGGVALAALLSALSDLLVVIILVPVALATACSYLDAQFSFGGYATGFWGAGVTFAAILHAVNPGFWDYIVYYTLIFAFALVPVVFFGRYFHKGRAKPRAPPTPAPVVALVGEPSAGKPPPRSRLEQLDQQSSLQYLCPYCNASVQLHDQTCPSCGAALDRRVPKIA